MQPPPPKRRGNVHLGPAPDGWSNGSPVEARPLLILGASVRAAVDSARRGGCRPIAADLFADLDLRRMAPALRVGRYPEGLWDASRTLAPASWMYTGALENYPDLVDRIAATRPLLGNSAAVLRRVRDPWLLQTPVREAGWRFPETRPLAACPTSGDWLRKPFRSANGTGIRITGNGDWRAQQGGSSVGSDTETATHYAQKFVPGVVCGAAFVANGRDATPLGVCRQLTGAGWLGAADFRYCGSIGPLRLSRRQRETVRNLGRALVAEFGLQGLFGVDFVMGRGAMHVLEVNPRYTASLEVIEPAWPRSAVRMHIDACQRGDLPPEPTHRLTSMWGKAILYARRDLFVTGQFLRWADLRNVSRREPNVADIPPPGQYVRRGSPVTTLLSRGPDLETVKRRLRGLATCAERLLKM